MSPLKSISHCIVFACTLSFTVHAQSVPEPAPLTPSGLYAFQSPTNPGNTVLIMTVNQEGAAAPSPSFRSDARYEFRIDNNGDAMPDLVFSLQFGIESGGDSPQPLTLSNGAGEVFVRGYTYQDVSIPSLGATLRCARFDDPYFADQVGLDNGFAFTGIDTFAGRDVNGIVLEIPSSQLTVAGSFIAIYAKTFLNNQPFSRLGRPFIGNLVGDAQIAAFHTSEPADDFPFFYNSVNASLAEIGSQQNADALTPILLPDLLTFDTNSSAGYLNGRKLEDDIVDTSLSLYTAGIVNADGVYFNDVPFPFGFPYLAPPRTAIPAAPLVVSSTADSGPGTLRTTLAAAPPGALIIFDPALEGETIRLTSGELLLSQSVQIDASSLARGVTIRSENLSRAFIVASTAAVTLRNLQILQCASTGDGGGILNEGVLRIDQCLLGLNISGSGGGAIANIGGDLQMINSSILLNQANFGGGILSRNSSLFLTHVTISQNEGTGGTGGIVIESGGDATIASSIIAANRAPTVETDIGGAGTIITSQGGNFIGTNSTLYETEFPAGSPNPNGDLVGIPASPLDPQLERNYLYTGSTIAYSPQTGSPVIDIAGPQSSVSTDQRGLPRLYNGLADAGAAEYQGVETEFNLYFKGDTDQDGVVNGIEIATGADPFGADPSSTSHLRISLLPNGNPNLTFGYNANVADDLILGLVRTQGIGTTPTTVISNEFSPFPAGNSINFEDTTPLPDKAFYRLSVTRRPEGGPPPP